MPFKWCIKADCQNNNRKVPQKEFISLPKGAYKRNKWLTLAGRNPEEIRRKSPVLWICEDHFDMENDFTNYHEYRFGNGKRLYKKYGMVPSKLVSEDKRAMLYHRNSRNFIDEPTNFECQYSNEDLDPIQGPLTTEDGIFTELLCFEDFTEAASLSPILSFSSSKHQTQDTNSGKQFSYNLDDKQRNFSSSEERNDISSDILRSTSFRRDIKENADPETKMALEFPPDTTKLLSNLEKTVRHSVLNDRIDEHENAETNVVKMTDDEIDNALQNVNHDHGYVFIPSQYNIHQSILPDFSLKDYYYAIVSPQNLKNVSKNTKILDNFFRGKHNKQDDIKFNDNKIIDCAGIIPIFACNYCNLGYINETSILSHVQRKHTEQYLFKHKIHFVRGVRFVQWKKQDVIKNKENDSAENIPTSKCFCCEKEFYYNTDLLKHLQEQHVFDDDNNIRDWCIIRSHCGERYCNKKGFIEYLRTLQSENESTDCADSIPIFIRNCSLKYISKTALLSYIKNTHTEKNCDNIILQREYSQKEYKSEINLLNHVEKLHDVNKETDSAEVSKCEFYQKEYKLERNLLKHVQKQHFVNKETNSPENRSTLKCSDKEFCYKADLLNHIQEQHLDIQKQTQGVQEKSVNMLEGFQLQFQSFIASHCTKEKQDKLDSMKIKENSNIDEIIPTKKKKSERANEEQHLDIQKEPQGVQEEFTNMLEGYQVQSFIASETQEKRDKLDNIKIKENSNIDEIIPTKKKKSEQANEEQHLDIQKEPQGVQEEFINFSKFMNECMKIKENSNIDEIIPTIKCCCNKTFHFKNDWLFHCQEQHVVDDGNRNSKPFKCYHCGRILKSKNSFSKHVRKLQSGSESRVSADKRNFQCCDKEFCYKADLLSHIEEQHLDMQEEPQGVQEEFINMLEGYQFQSLIASETQEKRDKLVSIKIKENSNIDEIIVPTIKCCCKQIFQLKKDWIFHCQEQHVVADGNRNSKPFKCYHCGKILKSKESFSNHIRKLQSGSEGRVSADKINFQCCDKEFVYKANFLNHIEKQHLDIQKEPQGVQEESINMLEGCKFESSIVSETQEKRDKLDNIKIKENSNIDEIISPIKCCCKKKFYRKNEWIFHFQEQHLVDIGNKNRKPFKCYHCGKIFKSKKGLSDHVRYNQTKLLSIYNRVTADKRNFQNHIKNKNTVKETKPILKCKYCPQEFKSNRCMLKHVQREHVVDKYTDSSENESTLICDEEYSSKRYTVSHFQDRHLDIQEQPQCIQEDHLSKSSTQDASSDIQQESLDIKEESQDEPLDIQQNSQDIQEEPLNIESEIFKCSKCPLSFLNEEEMSKHLKIIHGDLIDLYIGKLKSNRKDAKINEKRSKSLDEKQDIYSDYNFAQLETEIKIEISDHLEDIDLPYEQQLGLNLMYNLDPDFSVNQYNIHTNVQEANDTELAKDTYTTETITDFNPDTGETEYLESKNYIPTQEELLDHMHELINTKAKLYADAKQALKTNCMQLEDPNTSYDIPFLNESELLDNIHGVYDKSEKKQFNLEIVAENRIEVEENGSVKPVDPSVCRCCSKRLPIKIRIGKYDKICIKCQRIEKRNGKRRNSVKADLKSGTCENKPKNMSDAEILKNMNKFLNKRLKKMNRSSNRSKTNCVDDKIDVKKETLEGAFIFEDNDNDLLKPLREEEEKIIVQPHDPKLCKSCLVPLEVTESTGQNKTIKILCDKCKASETHNEKRRKSNEKRRKSNGNKIDKTFSKRNSELSCLICRCKFRNKLALRNHVARSHL